MSNWNMTVVGVGAHHNLNHRADADKQFVSFVEGLKASGHYVAHASFTWGGSSILVGNGPQETTEGAQDEQVEMLARELHEAGRSAVEKGLVVNKVPNQPFFEWDELTEVAQEGRREQARYLLSRFILVPR